MSKNLIQCEISYRVGKILGMNLLKKLEDNQDSVSASFTDIKFSGNSCSIEINKDDIIKSSVETSKVENLNRSDVLIGFSEYLYNEAFIKAYGIKEFNKSNEYFEQFRKT